MNIIDAIIQGIIQGATEFLPISSSGHLSLSKHFFGIEVESLFFDVLLHMGTLVAVFAVYYKTVIRLILAFFSLVKDIFTGKFKWKNMDRDRNLLMMIIIGLLPLFLLFVPVPGTGMKIKDYTDLWSRDSSIIIEGFALIVTSILLTLAVVFGRKNKNPKKEFNAPSALAVGIAQFFAAVFPGVSRSGSTLSVGMMKNIDRQTALDYSFVLGMPSIVAAFLLELGDALKENTEISLPVALVGALTAAVVGFFAIKLLKYIVATDKLYIFAIYAFLLGVFALAVGFIELSTGVNVFTGEAINF